MSRSLSDEDVEAIAARAAEIVLASPEFQRALRAAVRVQSQNTKTTSRREQDRAGARRQSAKKLIQNREQREETVGAAVLEMWEQGVPRNDIAQRLGFSGRAFAAELYRLRKDGHELAYRPGVD